MSDARNVAVKYAHVLSQVAYSKLLNEADHIEKLEAVVDALEYAIEAGFEPSAILKERLAALGEDK